MHKHSIELEPNGNGHKYLNLAEFLAGLESVKAYNKGIELLISQKQASTNESEIQAIAKQIASAHASIAELYMTDLWYIVGMLTHISFEEGAEAICEKSLQTALSVDPSNADALQCLANLRILRDKDTEGSELLDKVLAQVLSEGNESVIKLN